MSVDIAARLADVRAQVMLSLSTDFENYSVFKPAARKEKDVTAMLDQVSPVIAPQ